MSDDTKRPAPADLSDEELRTLLNTETARISWEELQPWFARGQVVHIKTGVDLIEAGVALIRDDSARFQNWQTEGLVDGVSNDQARFWYEQKAELWALVIAPWVLVQEPGGAAEGS